MFFKIFTMMILIGWQAALIGVQAAPPAPYEMGNEKWSSEQSKNRAPSSQSDEEEVELDLSEASPVILEEVEAKQKKKNKGKGPASSEDNIDADYDVIEP